jgi:hypothetical protein
MRQRRLNIGLICAVGCLLGGIVTSSAWAGEPDIVRCTNVQVANTGEYNEDLCHEKGGSKLYVETEGDGIAKGGGIECVLVRHRGNGQFNNSTCTEPGGSKNYIEVLLRPKFTGISGPTTLKAGTVATTACTAASSKGELIGAPTIGKLVVTFTGCETEGNKKRCTAKSVGASVGTVVTNALKGTVGTAKASSTGVGLLLEPESGGVFTTLAETACSIETSVEGGIIGDVKPVGVLSTTGKLNYASVGGKQAIKKITVAGVEKEKVLKAFGLVEVVEEVADELAFEEGVEIT